MACLTSYFCTVNFQYKLVLLINPTENVFKGGEMKMKMLAFVKLLIITLFLVSCAPSIKDSVSVDYAKAQAPTYPLKEYVIQPGDTLDVKFFYNPELNELLVTVRPDGRISLQLA